MTFFSTALSPGLRRRPRWPAARSGACAGLDLAGDRARLALLRRRGRHLDVALLAEHRFDAPICGDDGQFGDFTQLAHGCRLLMRRHAVHAGALVLALPVAAVSARRLTLPAGSNPVQRLAQVRAELAAYGLPVDEMIVDYRVLPSPAAATGGADVDVLALAAPAALADDRQALAELLSMRLRALPVAGDCTAAFLRGPADAVLHLAAGDAWYCPPASACMPLHWRAPAAPHTPIAASLPPLLQALAPQLQAQPPRRILVTGNTGDAGNVDDAGDGNDLATVAATVASVSGIRTVVAPLPSQIAGNVAALAAALPQATALPAYHGALALAARGLA